MDNDIDYDNTKETVYNTKGKSLRLTEKRKVIGSFVSSYNNMDLLRAVRRFLSLFGTCRFTWFIGYTHDLFLFLDLLITIYKSTVITWLSSFDL